MAHLVDTASNGQATVVVRRGSKDPWWTTASFRPGAVGTDWTVEDIIKSFHPYGGDVALRTLAVRGSEGRAVPLADFRGVGPIDRPDTIFSVVSPKYRIVQFSETLERCKRLGLQIETAGVLDGGKRFWALANFGSADVARGDEIHQRLLISAAHDGASRVVYGPTSHRPVCANTLQPALRGEDLMRFSHRGDIAAKLDVSENALAKINTDFATMLARYRDFVSKPLRGNEAEAYFRKTLGLPTSKGVKSPTVEIPSVDEVLGIIGAELSAHNARLVDAAMAATEVASEKKSRILAEVLEYYEMPETTAARGTLWGAYNAVTRLATHGGNDRDAESRISSLIAGQGATRQAAAFSNAVSLLRD